jgi:hypothetical protein
VLALTGTRPILAQHDTSTVGIDSAKAAAIRQLLETMGAGDVLLVGIERGIEMERAADPDMPPEFWDVLIKKARSDAGRLVEMLIPVYDRSFT